MRSLDFDPDDFDREVDIGLEEAVKGMMKENDVIKEDDGASNPSEGTLNALIALAANDEDDDMPIVVEEPEEMIDAATVRRAIEAIDDGWTLDNGEPEGEASENRDSQ